MQRNMKQWIEEVRISSIKKAFPILFFPTTQLMEKTVKDLISSSDNLAKGMKLVADRVDSVAAISLMDLSVEAECFGSQIIFSESEVPTVKGNIITEVEEVEALEIPAIGTGRTGIYIDAVRKASELILDRPLFAGMIGPYSLSGRLLDVTEIMYLCYDEPEMVLALLDKVTEFLIAYGKAYKKAGANGIMIAEPLAGLLSPDMEAEFSAPFVKRIVEALQEETFAVIYHNCGDNTMMMLDSILTIGADAYHFGNSINMEEMLQRVPNDIVVMGNIDPAGQFCHGIPESIRKETVELLKKCSKYSNFVISSGCDIPPMSPWENIDAFFDAVKDFYGK